MSKIHFLYCAQVKNIPGIQSSVSATKNTSGLTMYCISKFSEEFQTDYVL